jgi:hypothetical protein
MAHNGRSILRVDSSLFVVTVRRRVQSTTVQRNLEIAHDVGGVGVDELFDVE